MHDKKYSVAHMLNIEKQIMSKANQNLQKRTEIAIPTAKMS